MGEELPTSRTGRRSGYVARKEDEGKMSWFFSQNHAWFASFAPAKSPEVAVAVLVEHGGSGPEVAVPVAMQIVHEYERLKAARLGHALSSKPTTTKTRTAGARP